MADINRRLDRDIIDKALNELRDVEREALFLSVVERQTAQQIADSMQCPRGTVLSVLHRARRKLKHWLASFESLGDAR